MGLFDFIARTFGRAPAPARENRRPKFMASKVFMAWHEAVKPHEHKLLVDWDFERDYADDSFFGGLIERVQWRYEGWRGCHTVLSWTQRREFDPKDWWEDTEFMEWHDRQYSLDEWGTPMSAVEIGTKIREFMGENDHVSKRGAEGLYYESVKGLKRRYQGWCGRTQVDSGRVVCPECGSWKIESRDDGMAYCLGEKNEYQFCKNEWKPTWPLKEVNDEEDDDLDDPDFVDGSV